MSLVKLAIKHGRTLDEARTLLGQVVAEVQGAFGVMVQRTEWNADRSAARMTGTGFEVELRVDAHEVHVTGDLPFLGGLLGGPWASGLKGLVEGAIRKRLR